MLVSLTSIGISFVLFPFASFTTTLVLPADTGVIVSVLPSILAVAYVSGCCSILNVPAFSPPNVTVWSLPFTYAITLSGLAVIVVPLTSILIVTVLFPFDSFIITVVLPGPTGVIVTLFPLNSTCAIPSSAGVCILNSPKLVPSIVTVLLSPPAYITTFGHLLLLLYLLLLSYFHLIP